MRYSAFISYNHRDKREAAWLHRSLETYRIPRRLRGRETPLGTLGSRLPPVFRDREELAASPDLAQSVRDALAVSGSLVVICSPNGAKSLWVNEEIRAFTALGRRHRIQCLIVGGAVDGAAGDYMPPALFDGGASEPLAADLRSGADSRRDALLKLMAGMLAVPYDELRQRDQARRQRQLATAAAAFGAGFVVMSGLAVTAFLARNEALHQRDIARRKTETAERTVDFVKSLFDDADPSQARGATITAREILDRGSRQISQDLSDEPSVKAELETTLGDVYAGLGLFHQGETLIRQGLALGNVDVSTRARQYAALGDAQSRQSDYDGAIASYQRALKLSQDPDAVREDLTTRILVGLGEAQSELGEDAPAERTLAAALTLDEKTLGGNDPSVARDLEALGPNDMAAGRLDEGKQDLQRALAIRLKTQGALHPRSAEDLNSLGAIAYLQADPVAAESYWRQALASYRTVLGDDHPEVATTMNNLALVELERRDFVDAKPLLEHAVAVVIKQRNESSTISLSSTRISAASSVVSVTTSRPRGSSARRSPSRANTSTATWLRSWSTSATWPARAGT